MVFYFSATGNSKHVAQRVADATGEDIVSIAECVKEGRYRFVVASESVGIVAPAYAWGLPSVVCDFLQRLSFDREPVYLWYAATFGSTPGRPGWFANRIMKQKGLTFDAYFGVKMPDTWTPIFDLSDTDKVERINVAAEKQIDFAIERVRDRVAGDFVPRKVPVFAAKIFYSLEYDAMRKTKHFTVEDSCIGCGLCARKCPVSAIRIEGGKPVWVKDECAACLACLHHCPKFSIQYGSRTKGHGQYTHPGK